MKTLQDVKEDMSELYADVRERKYDLKRAKGLANIASVYLRACEVEFVAGCRRDG